MGEDGSASDDLAAGVELALIEFLFGFQLEATTTLLLLSFFECGDLFGAGASGHGMSRKERIHRPAGIRSWPMGSCITFGNRGLSALTVLQR